MFLWVVQDDPRSMIRQNNTATWARNDVIGIELYRLVLSNNEKTAGILHSILINKTQHLSGPPGWYKSCRFPDTGCLRIKPPAVFVKVLESIQYSNLRKTVKNGI